MIDSCTSRRVIGGILSASCMMDITDLPVFSGAKCARLSFSDRAGIGQH
jgi:hypothetical protein